MINKAGRVLQMSFALVAVFALSLALTGCGGGGGSKYLGVWENTKQKGQYLEIVRNDDNFLITQPGNDDKTVGILKDGLLRCEAVGWTFSYVKSSETLLLNHSGGGAEEFSSSTKEKSNAIRQARKKRAEQVARENNARAEAARQAEAARAEATRQAELVEVAAAKAREEAARAMVEQLAKDLIWIKAGSFEMGSPDGEKDRGNDETQHQVTLTKGFWMGKYEVTQEQWEQVMGSNPSHFKGSNLPVEKVSWNDCQAFIEKLNASVSVSGGTFRLPTEAEWEYACRAWTKGTYAGELDSMAWSNPNSSNKTHEVGSKEMNGFGLYDMHGNVWEWCQDLYGDYPAGSSVDPTGSVKGVGRVNRGGSWARDGRRCRSAVRYWNRPSDRHDGLGLRLVRQ